MDRTKMTHRSFGAATTLIALGACQTVSPVTQAETVVAETAAPDDTTGAGIYYPVATSFDAPDIRFGMMAGVGPTQRQGFVDQINFAATSAERAIPIVAQAVGTEQKSLVFMLIDTDTAMTPYLARAVLARLTSLTRFAPAIAELGLSSEFDVFNTAAVLGFDRVVVTDGQQFSHEATLRPN